MITPFVRENIQIEFRFSLPSQQQTKTVTIQFFFLSFSIIDLVFGILFVSRAAPCPQ